MNFKKALEFNIETVGHGFGQTWVSQPVAIAFTLRTNREGENLPFKIKSKNVVRSFCVVHFFSF